MSAGERFALRGTAALYVLFAIVYAFADGWLFLAAGMLAAAAALLALAWPE